MPKVEASRFSEPLSDCILYVTQAKEVIVDLLVLLSERIDETTEGRGIRDQIENNEMIKMLTNIYDLLHGLERELIHLCLSHRHGGNNGLSTRWRMSELLSSLEILRQQKYSDPGSARSRKGKKFPTAKEVLKMLRAILALGSSLLYLTAQPGGCSLDEGDQE